MSIFVKRTLGNAYAKTVLVTINVSKMQFEQTAMHAIN